MNKLTKIKKSLITILLSSLCFSYTTIVSARDSLNSNEIKSLRFISRSVLKSRVQDKKQIEKSLVALRLNMKNVQAEMTSLKSQLMKESITVRLSKKGSNTNKKFKSTRKDKIRNVISGVKSRRIALEGELPKFWQFWKKKEKNNKQKQLWVDKLRNLENELVVMKSTGKFNLKDINQLNESIKLKKMESSLDKIAPTLQSKTKHRN